MPDQIYRRKVAKVFRDANEAVDVRYIGLHGGRGSGKSHFFAEKLVERMATRTTRWLCCREIQKSLDESVKRLIEDKVIRMGLGHVFELQDRYTKCSATDSLIAYTGMQNMNAHSVKSYEGFDGAWFEEAQACSQRSLTLLRPTIRKPGSQMWFSWNPNFATDPIEQLLRGKEAPPRSVVTEANWRDNPFFTDELEEERSFDERRDPDLYQHVWEGQYINLSSARVFANWKVREFEAPEGTIFYYGADWGFSRDPSVLVRMFIVGRTIFIDHEAYAVGCEIDKTPFLFGGASNEQLIEKNREAYNALTAAERQWQGVPGATAATVRADSARPETIAYMVRHGFPKMIGAAKGAGSVEEGVEFLKSYDVVIHPRCKRTAAEFKLYSYKVDPHTEEVTSVLADRDNHVIDAVRYALEQVRRKKTTRSGELSI